MLPSVLVKQLQQGLGDYLETTYPMTNAPFKGSLANMIATASALVHEPYLAVRLPFKVADSPPTCFTALHPTFAPYKHQQRAFARLCGEDMRSTLVATGTGSGKTECFLYPILEYCYRHREERGIKALIIYPMNALASDQAKRLAELIWHSPELKNNVSAGMYVGGVEADASPSMTEHGLITDRQTLINAPPDILLTNYKMLDYLLVRPKDAELWKQNRGETLKLIAVDELHTFDGAQGTDLACLLRRLKARLDIAPGYLCCVGTSATMGSGDSGESIRRYAEGIFGEPFEDDSLIVEERQSAEEFFAGLEADDFKFPAPEQLAELEICRESDDEVGYLRSAAAAWLGNFRGDVATPAGRLELGDCLKRHDFTQYLLRAMDGHYCQVTTLVAKLRNSFSELGALGDGRIALNALFALISHARRGTKDRLYPFLQVQVQLWMRELSRVLGAVVDQKVTYSLASELNAPQTAHYLPVVNCRDCGNTGWASLLNERQNVTLTNLAKFYQAFFKADSSVALMFPYEGEHVPDSAIPARLCPKCMQCRFDVTEEKNCLQCGTSTLNVYIPLRKGGDSGSKQFVCPCCGSRGSLSLLGMRSATEISAAISQLFASKFNDDKKTLTFSDSVQDASHRAGFFNFRTWRFGLRRAIQRYVQAGGAGQTLAEFIPGLVKYWHREMSPEEFVSFFIAPNLVWLRGYEKLLRERKLKRRRDNDQDTAVMFDYIEKRLSYEVLQEYGILSQVGRTLQKSACSCLAFSSEQLVKVAAAVRERTVSELGILSDLATKPFEQMVAGYVEQLRLRGALANSVFSSYVFEGGNSYLLSASRLKWAPGVRGGNAAPRFMVYPGRVGSGSQSNLDYVGTKQYLRWIETCIYRNAYCMLRVGDLAAISAIIVEELERAELLVPFKIKMGGQAYGLNPKHLRVCAEVGRWRCGKCGAKYSWSRDLADIWEGAPCFRPGCEGNLEQVLGEDRDYYAQLFRGGDLIRTNAREHTGLLKRDDREKLEQEFKLAPGERKAWDPNVLSCTPTLEMGIDIGDLSTVIMCSMPPAQAQFLQRAGRAGRRDGNSLTLAVAAARPHDMYFYADPLEMIEGNVAAPHIFLEASAVLERQFIAFCMDSWVKSGVPVQAIPSNVGACLSNVRNNNEDAFPFNFLKFVKTGLKQRLYAFCQLFEDMPQLVKDEISLFACGDGLKKSPLDVKVLAAFEELQVQHESLQKNIKQLKAQIADLKTKPHDRSFDEDIKELNLEIKALRGVLKDLRGKNVFNFLSDEGLLPNYAFPEGGTTLKAVLWRRETEGESEDGIRRPSVSFNCEWIKGDWSRGASAALSELAPNNSFYVDGKKLVIDQIDMSAASEARWRFCPNCSHIQLEDSVNNRTACPRCGDRGWADAGQVRTVLKVPVVYSNMDYQKSFSGDESEERTFVFYNRMLLVDVDEEHDIQSAFRLDNEAFSFGYDYAKKATLREINFGTSDTVGEKLRVAGHEDVRNGFKICRYCGKVQPEKGEPTHTKYCLTRNKPELEAEASGSYMFIYREFQTEILRLLIPATTFDTNKCNTESFIAAFMLGLKEHFGNVSHLAVTISDVPVAGENYRKQYLIVYDTVPGGTGYLKQLMQRESALTEVLEKSLYVMENCKCKDDQAKDGCYHCLFAYAESRHLMSISRRAAMRLLQTIVSGKDNLQRINGLGEVPVNTLFDSELEKRFVENLTACNREGRRVELRQELFNKKQAYLLSLDGGAGKKATWIIEPQCHLGPSDGVSVHCKPDFVFHPVSDRARRRVAVFTDGFAPHQNKVDDDTLKREAIRRSGKYWVWSFSWEDVNNTSLNQGQYATPTLAWELMPRGISMYQPAVQASKAAELQPWRQSSLDLFLSFLAAEQAEVLFATQARAYALSLLDLPKGGDTLAVEAWRERVRNLEEVAERVSEEWDSANLFLGRWSPRQNSAALEFMAGIDMMRLINDRLACPAVFAVLDDRENSLTDMFQKDWNGFWHFCNVMQYVPSFLAVCEKGVQNRGYSDLKSQVTSPVLEDEPVAPTEYEEAWESVRSELEEEEAVAMAVRLQKLGAPVPTLGEDIVDEQGAVVATAELVWFERQICYLTGEQARDKKRLLALGWRVIEDGDEIEPSIFGGNGYE